MRAVPCSSYPSVLPEAGGCKPLFAAMGARGLEATASHLYAPSPRLRSALSGLLAQVSQCIADDASHAWWRAPPSDAQACVQDLRVEGTDPLRRAVPLRRRDFQHRVGLLVRVALWLTCPHGRRSMLGVADVMHTWALPCRHSFRALSRNEF